MFQVRCQFAGVTWHHVVFVKSTAGNYHRRELLRRTWAVLGYVGGARFDTVFLIGRTNEAGIQVLMDEEHQRYGDILQYNGPDEYRCAVTANYTYSMTAITLI